MFGRHLVVNHLFYDTEFHMHLNICPDVKNAMEGLVYATRFHNRVITDLT